MYQNEMARSGHALFTVRGFYIHVVIIVGAGIAWLFGQQGPFASEDANCWWQAAAFVIALGAALWRFIVSGYAALGTSGSAMKQAEAAELNTTGPYSLVRNPLYVGRILNFTGMAMMSGSWVYGALVFLVSVLVYERISIYEEQFLSDKFGEAHRRWAGEVPALLPRLNGWVKPKYAFWWRRAILREYNKFFHLATAVVLIDLARRGFTLPQDLLPYQVYGGVLVCWLGLSAAKYLGKVFDGIK